MEEIDGEGVGKNFVRWVCYFVDVPLLARAGVALR